MKIGIVCYPSIGGSGVVATELGKAMSRRGHEVHFFSYDIPRKLENATEKFHFHHVDVPMYPLFRFPPYTLALASSIYEACVENPLDVLHVHYAIPHATSAFIAKQMLCTRKMQKMRVITTLHGTDMDLVGQHPSYKPVVEYSIEFSNAVTAVSHYLKDAIKQYFTINRDIHVIYNPIDTELYAPLPDSQKRKNGEKLIIHMSNFRPVKRTEDVVKVFDLIAAAMPARLLFIGEGPDRANAEMTVKRLGLSDRVDFLGPRNDVEDMLKKADLLISTSESESFGLTIAEAMACEVPVVATRVGGVPEVVEDNVCGLLAPLGCITTMARSAIRILSSSKLQRSMGEAGRQRVLKYFEMEKITNCYETLYNQVLESDDLCPEHIFPMPKEAETS